MLVFTLDPDSNQKKLLDTNLNGSNLSSQGIWEIMLKV